MDKIPRALISFAFVADRFEATNGDIFQGLVPLFAPIVQARADQIFDPVTFVDDLRTYYDIVMPAPVAQDWASRLEKEGYLSREDIGPGHVHYHYKTIDVTFQGQFEQTVTQLLSEFSDFVAKTPARAELPESLDLEQEFFDRLLNIDSLAIFHRPDRPQPVRKSRHTITLVRPPTTENNLHPRNPVQEHLDYLFVSFVEHLRQTKPDALSTIADVTTGALLAEVVIGMQSPPSKGDEFEHVHIYLDAPLVMDLLGINPGRKEYAQDLLAALKACNASVFLFDHSVDEIERAIAHRIEADNHAATQRLGYNYRTIGAAHDKLYLVTMRGHVANSLDKLGLKITSLQGDPYQRTLKYFSEDDESELSRRIGSYLYVEAREADAKSLGHVIRLRGASDASPNVLRARAVLVSRNGRLVNLAAKFLAHKQGESRKNSLANKYRDGDAPICITDSEHGHRS